MIFSPSCCGNSARLVQHLSRNKTEFIYWDTIILYRNTKILSLVPKVILIQILSE